MISESVFVTFLLLFGVVAQEPAPPVVADRLSAARVALDELRLEEAAVMLEALVAEPGVADGLRADAWLVLGQTRAGLLDDAGAEVAFAAALAIDGSLTLPSETSPKVAALFAATRTQMSPAGLPPKTPPPPPPPPPPPAPPPPDSEVEAVAKPSTESLPWPTLWVSAGAAALMGGAALTAVAWFADDTLNRPKAGRTRAEYDGIRNLGLASVAGGSVLGFGGVVSLCVGAWLYAEEE